MIKLSKRDFYFFGCPSLAGQTNNNNINGHDAQPYDASTKY